MNQPQQSAPERTSDLEEIIHFYHFLLVDNCLIHAGSGLSEQLYMVKEPARLLRFSIELEDLTQNIQMLQSYISRYKHLHITPEIQQEMMPFTAHLRQVTSYHRSKLSQQQRELRQKNGRPRFSRWNKQYNRTLERLEEEDFDPSDYNSRVEQTLRLMQDAADGVESLSKGFPVYQRSGNLPRLSVMKASMADASLVGALVDYAQKSENRNHTAAILTADGDVISLFHKHLQTLSPAEQIDLSSRIAVHFRSHAEKVLTRIGYCPPLQVRKSEGYS